MICISIWGLLFVDASKKKRIPENKKVREKINQTLQEKEYFGCLIFFLSIAGCY